MFKNPQAKKALYIGLAVGAVLGLVIAVFLPDDYNPVKMMVEKFKPAAK